MNVNNDLLEHICNKYCELMGYVPKFIKDDEIDEQDVFDNPNNYIMGRQVKSEYDAQLKLYATVLYIKIYKVAPNFNDRCPMGKYIDGMYLSPWQNMSDILNYVILYVNTIRRPRFNTTRYY